MSVSTSGKPRLGPLDKRSLLREHPIFQGLDSRIIDQLASRAVTRKIKKGTVLFRKGDSGTMLYAVLSGLVRISATAASGKDSVFNLIAPGEVLGEIAVLDGGMRTADAVIVEDSEVMIIERRDFMPTLAQFPELPTRLIAILCARVRRTSEQVEDILFLSLSERLAKVLLHLHARSSTQSGPGGIRITQREISQIVGASRESTNKQLRQWQRLKLLKVERSSVVVLAPKALAKYVPEI